MDLYAIREKYCRECLDANQKNIEAHDAFQLPIESVSITRIAISRGYEPLPEGTYDTSKKYLAFYDGKWLAGTIQYYEPQKRFIFYTNYGIMSMQVEHLLQLYMIDLPEVPTKLVPWPEKPEELEDDIRED
jgi:hypothetical protein